MKDRVLPLALAIAGALLAIGILTFAGPCLHDDGTVSTCFAASRVVLGAGIAAIIAGLLGAALRSLQAKVTLSIIGICAGIAAVAAPGGLLPLCMMQTMRCWTIMRPYALALGAVIVILAAAFLLATLHRRVRAHKALKPHGRR